MKLSLGVDLGSTTAKIVVQRDDTAVFTRYARHYSKIRDTVTAMLAEAADALSALGIGRDAPFSCAMSGSAGMGLAEAAGVPFVQEVWATGQVVRRLEPDTDAVIELGGEDAKILFFGGSVDERMNGACAGGTGAFIDQMASLLDMTPDELDEASLRYEKLYPIASRCGVFAKTDIQPLLNQGARKEDVAASIYQAVVNQTISGLAQGRRITGKVMFLGGPLSFCKGLRDRFVDTLGLVPGKSAIFPDYARTACALGAALYAQTVTDARAFTIDSLTDAIRNAQIRVTSTRLPPLFRDRDEYEAFAARHRRATVPMAHADTYTGKAWLGIDCGSTTTKMVLIGEADEILFSYYDSNRGNPVSVVREQLLKVRELTDRRGIEICGCAVTGYGEELIKTAFHGDMGLVETMAHFTAARHFAPDVDFILDIGGQDIKCFRIKNGAIDSIMLNEACSSGCGSFIETFAHAMGYSSPDFARLGLFAEAPVNLGSRCTVFMNSQVKQSQKDGASVADISAGLSVSVVKNAIYKVIRAHSPDELGAHIVVQGGTFHNDAVLRAFERETGREVVRPSIAGLMGAYGAALRVKESLPNGPSRLAATADLQSFRHTARVTNCNGCTNRCLLTVNVFADGTRCISGNKCEKPTGAASSAPLPDLYACKRDWLYAGETFFEKKDKHEVLEPPAPPSKKLYEGGKDGGSAETDGEAASLDSCFFLQNFLVPQRRVTDQHRDKYHKRRCGKADRVCRHNGAEGLVLREDQLDPRDTNAAYADHRQHSGECGDPETSQVPSHHLIKQAERMGQHDHHQADIAGFDDLRIPVEEREQVLPEKEQQGNGAGQCEDPLRRLHARGHARHRGDLFHGSHDACSLYSGLACRSMDRIRTCRLLLHQPRPANRFQGYDTTENRKRYDNGGTGA